MSGRIVYCKQDDGLEFECSKCKRPVKISHQMAFFDGRLMCSYCMLDALADNYEGHSDSPRLADLMRSGKRKHA